MSLLRLAVSVLVASAATIPSLAKAQELSFGAPFSDQMVLQRGQPIPVWGQGEPGTSVEVTIANQAGSVRVSSDGSWKLEFAPMEAATGLTISLVGSGKPVELTDIAVGDVFLCSGQSNMEFRMSATALRSEDRRPPIDASIRLLTVPRASAQVEASGFVQTASWESAAKKAADFSAVCLLAGRELALSEGVTVGLINASWGGTQIRAWLPYEGLKLAGGMDDQLAILDAYRRDPVAAAAQHGSTMADASRPNGFANLFNGMIAPLGPTRLKGAIWYQGEANARLVEGTPGYRNLLGALLSTWRGRFGTEVPFVVVQLAAYGQLSGKADNDDWAAVREAQRLVARDDPATELVVTIDIGERLDIHPPLKKPVGQRSAAALRKLAYGKPDAYRPPEALSARRLGDTIAIAVSQANGPLIAASWGRPGPFMVCTDAAGADCRFADAQFSEGGVSVTIPAGLNPALVRYCWDAAPICNVFDQAEMPLGPFELAVE